MVVKMVVWRADLWAELMAGLKAFQMVEPMGHQTADRLVHERVVQMVVQMVEKSVLLKDDLTALQKADCLGGCSADYWAGQ